jgi:acetolactate synthase I/II/III large subunit
MVMQELATAVCDNFPVKVVILNNGFLGMIRQWQDLFYEKRLCHSCLRHASGEYFPDFVKLADAFGTIGIRIKEPSELRAKLTEAFAIPKPVLIDVIVADDEKVFPMVPAGAAISEMLIES